MKNLIVLILLMGFVIGITPTTQAAIDPNLNAEPRLMGVDGPRVIPAGESADWNQQITRSKTAPDFSLKNMRWTWGDGTKSGSENSHIYKKPGRYKAKVEGLNDKGVVIDTVKFEVLVKKAKKYKIKILNLDTKKDYRIGSSIPVSWKTTGVPKENGIGMYVGFLLVNNETGKEYFITDAHNKLGGSISIDIPGKSDYSQDGPIPLGEYRLKAYMYGGGTNKYPSVLSKTFEVISEN